MISYGVKCLLLGLVVGIEIYRNILHEFEKRHLWPAMLDFLLILY